MRILFWRAVVPALVLVLGGLRPLSAQAIVRATTFVPVASPTGIGVRNLSFGNITPTAGGTQTVNVPAAVAPQSTTQAGQFDITVEGAAGVGFELTMPTVLTSTIGGLTLPVSFNGNQFGAHCVVNASTPCTLTAFDPGAGGTITVCARLVGSTCHRPTVWMSNTRIHVYLGGSVDVAPSSAAATYVGVITLSIVQVY